MSRSKHATKRDLQRERKFAKNDALPIDDAMTELEITWLQKLACKINERWRRHADVENAPISGEVSYELGTGVKKKLIRRSRRHAAEDSSQDSP